MHGNYTHDCGVPETDKIFDFVIERVVGRHVRANKPKTENRKPKTSIPLCSLQVFFFEYP